MPDYKEDLEKAVKLVLEAGLSTGHADSFPKLMEEVLKTVKEMRAYRGFAKDLGLTLGLPPHNFSSEINWRTAMYQEVLLSLHQARAHPRD